MVRQFCLLIAALLLIAVSPPMAAQNFNVDLGDYWGTPSDAFGAAPGQTGHWNTIGRGTTYGLESLNSATTGVNISVSADSDRGYGTGCCCGDTNSLSGDQIHTQAGKWFIDLANLKNGVYDLFLYATNNQAVATGNMLIDGIAIPEIKGTVNCGMNEGYDWISLKVMVTGGALSMMGDSVGTWDFYAGLAGFQLRETDEFFLGAFESGDFGDWIVFPSPGP